MAIQIHLLLTEAFFGAANDSYWYNVCHEDNSEPHFGSPPSPTARLLTYLLHGAESFLRS